MSAVAYGNVEGDFVATPTREHGPPSSLNHSFARTITEGSVLNGLKVPPECTVLS
jgi:hypothetical protein